jgi:hypothetical protein
VGVLRLACCLYIERRIKEGIILSFERNRAFWHWEVGRSGRSASIVCYQRRFFPIFSNNIPVGLVLSIGIRAFSGLRGWTSWWMQKQFRIQQEWWIFFDELLKELRDCRRELKELWLSIPIFEGKNADGWLVKVEEFFYVKEEHIPEVVRWVGGQALTWYQLWVSSNPNALRIF